ncbi:M48 family metallopeptidase [uncultured Cocleimonas sp.]|uniref:M48 family metallopeptidase n=1 Tax=uncultured Cocleimonas sp. TaxID=1051587 RepID=UPI002603DFDD|nr:M48 family metallopeptidase [uncultured Cocleimonas sp.]
MQYENPQIPEDINTSKENPLKEFSTLLIGSIALVILVSLVLSVGGSWLAGLIPYNAEKKVAGLYDVSAHDDNKEHQQITEYLQQLADKISKTQNLPEEIKIKIHYMHSDTMNAFATLGGNVFMFKGLLEKLPNENTLVTLLGHEIAHVKYRHPIKSLGSGIAVSIAMTTLGRSADSQILGDTGLLSTLHFSREMEKQSDLEAMNTLQALYGHLNGGAELFRIFHNERAAMDSKAPAEFFSTHPLDEKRIQSFSNTAKEKGWAETGTLTPLPDFYRNAFN